MNGCLILLLHAHLPYVRHPEYEYSLEENWLFEAIRETYVPLLDMLEGLAADGISPNLTLSISPPLIEMLNDELLRERFVRSLDNLIGLSEAEKKRTRGTPFEVTAHLYSRRLREVRKSYTEKYGRDLIAPFRKLQDGGHIEIVATAATHAFLPAYSHYPETVRNQIELGIRSYVRSFGKRPAGFWLPECGYFNGLDSFLRDAGIKYFFLESHGVIHGRPRPQYSIYKPVMSPSGLAVFGRDFKSARQVWCASRGYPGDPHYRDFYRDIGFDLPESYISRFTHMGGFRTFTGMKYHRIEEGEGGKLPYSRAAAMGRVAEHAAHFVRERETYCSRLSKYVPRPVVLSAFDAELFGHWWHEGIEWLDAVLRRAEGRKSLSVAVVTPSRYLELIAGKKRGNAGSPVHLAPSSWGEGGYNATWIGERNGHLYRHLHRMAERMTVLVQGRIAERERRGENAKARRVVSQAMRELLLAQASDWAFLMEKDRAARYAENRVMGHIENFDVLFSMMKNNHIETAALKEMEKRHNIFGWARRPEDYWPLPFASRSS